MDGEVKPSDEFVGLLAQNDHVATIVGVGDKRTGVGGIAALFRAFAQRNTNGEAPAAHEIIDVVAIFVFGDDEGDGAKGDVAIAASIPSARLGFGNAGFGPAGFERLEFVVSAIQGIVQRPRIRTCLPAIRNRRG